MFVGYPIWRVWKLTGTYSISAQPCSFIAYRMTGSLEFKIFYLIYFKGMTEYINLYQYWKECIQIVTDKQLATNKIYTGIWHS